MRTYPTKRGTKKVVPDPKPVTRKVKAADKPDLLSQIKEAEVKKVIQAKMDSNVDSKKRRGFNQEIAEKCQVLASYGMPGEQIAVVLDLGRTQMYNLYGKYLAKGLNIGNAAIAQRLYQKAMDGDLTALIFLAKVRLGMHEYRKPEDNHSQKPVIPVKRVVITSENLKKLEKICSKIDWSDEHKQQILNHERGQVPPGRLLS